MDHQCKVSRSCKSYWSGRSKLRWPAHKVSGMCGRKALCLPPGDHNEAMYLTRFPSLPCRIILYCPVMWAFTPACLPRVKLSKTTYQHTHIRRSHDVTTATTCERVNLPIHFSIRRKAVAVHALLPLCKDLGNLLREKDSSRCVVLTRVVSRPPCRQLGNGPGRGLFLWVCTAVGGAAVQLLRDAAAAPGPEAGCGSRKRPRPGLQVGATRVFFCEISQL